MSTDALIALALILDFSGSMDQKLEDKSKRDILVENMGALSSSYRAQDPILVISFGSGKSAGCDGMEVALKRAEELDNWATHQRPGKFAMTPLGASIRMLAQKTATQKIARTLIITDGQDTCGDDPCKALEKLDESLTDSIEVDLLGYDMTNEEQAQSRCEGHPFKHVRFTTHFAKTNLEFADQLQKIQHEAQNGSSLAGRTTLEIQEAPATQQFTATYRPPRIRPTPRKRGAPAP
ncbi:hypothetical protein WDW37_17955, partial [Bdellovibrionota bacterium FG-1]